MWRGFCIVVHGRFVIFGVVFWKGLFVALRGCVKSVFEGDVGVGEVGRFGSRKRGSVFVWGGFCVSMWVGIIEGFLGESLVKDVGVV